MVPEISRPNELVESSDTTWRFYFMSASQTSKPRVNYFYLMLGLIYAFRPKYAGTHWGGCGNC